MFRWVFSLFTSLFIVVLFAQTSQALSIWDEQNGAVSFYQQSQTTALIGQPTPEEYVIEQQNCQKMDFVTKTKFIDGIIQIGSKEITSVCAVPVPGGYMSFEGYYLKNGNTLAGKISVPDSARVIFKPIANSNDLIAIYTRSNNNVRIIKNAYSNMSVIKGDREISYKINLSNPSFLNNGTGQKLIASINTISISNNSKWLVLEDKTRAFVRINLDTLEALNFSKGFRYDLGYNPNPYTAISDNGQFAVVSSDSTTSFRLFDLDQCKPDGGCFYRSLQKDMNNILPNFRAAYNLRFIDNTISFMGVSNIISGVSRVLGKYYIGAPNTNITSLENTYLALGDSFASGEGAYQYIKATDTANNRCHQSAISYPYIIKKNLTSLKSANSVACSGAKMKDVYYFNELNYNKNENQAKGKLEQDHDNEIYFNYLPGYRSQHNFLSKSPKPNIVTLSIFGNDIGFSSIIKSCVSAPTDCYQSQEDRLEIINNINNGYNSLINTYKSIKDNSAFDAKIYVVGYPKIAKTAGNCGVNVGLSNNEINFADGLTNYVNSVIQKASLQAGLYYVDSIDAFMGHRLCESTKDNIAVNGLTSGDSAPLKGIGPLAAESYHPNKLGHELFATSILQKTNNFTTTMPQPTNYINLPDPYSLNIIKSAPAAHRPVYSSQYNDDLAREILYKDQPFNITLKNSDSGLNPNQDYNVVMYSEPTNLGVVRSNETGDINATISLPSNLDAGYHTLKIEGLNQTDQRVSVQKIVYVANAQNMADSPPTQNAVLNSTPNVQPSINATKNTQTDKETQPNIPESIIGSIINNINNSPTVGQYLSNLNNTISALSGYRANSDIDSLGSTPYSQSNNTATIYPKTKDAGINILPIAMFMLFVMAIFITIYKVKPKTK